MKKLLLILALAIAALPLKAYVWSDVNEQGVTIYYNITGDNTCEVTKHPDGSYIAESIRIPEKISYTDTEDETTTWRVTGIGDGAFWACKTKKFILPGNLEYIGNDAFRNSYCEFIVLPYTLKRIGDRAFYNDEKLHEIDVEFDDPSDIEIGTEVFEYIDKESCSLWVPIGSKSNFQNSPHWNYFEKVQELFFNFIEDGIAYSVLDEAAGTCEITSRDIYGYSAIVHAIVPPTIEHRGKSYTPVGVGDYAFEDRKISYLSLPSTIEYIGEGAFSYATSNDEEWEYINLTIPSSVKEIRDVAFNCCAIYNIYCQNTQPDDIKLGDDVFSGIPNIRSSTLYVPIGCVDAYKAAPQWQDFVHIEEDDYHFIYEDIKYKISESNPSKCYVVEDTRNYPMEEVVIPETVYSGMDSYKVTVIGGQAFYRKKIEHIILPETIISIGGNAFSWSRIEAINIPAAVREIGRNAFVECSKLNSLICEVPDPYDIAMGEDVFYSVYYTNIDFENCVLYVPKESIDLYRAADQWKDFVNIQDIESGIESVAADAADNSDCPAVYYNLNGAVVPATDLAPGLYIRRQGSEATKVVIR